MLRWDEIEKLHVVRKFKMLFFKWFGVEIFYFDKNSEVIKNHWNKDAQHPSTLVHFLFQYGSGPQLLGFERDEEKSGGMVPEWTETPLTPLQGLHLPLLLEGERVASLYAYPILRSPLLTQNKENLAKSVSAMGISSQDFLKLTESLKPLSIDQQGYLQELLQLLGEEITTYHLEFQKKEEAILHLQSQLEQKYRYHAMIGKSPKMQELYHLLERVQHSEASILIQGENGTGKELVAKAIHYQSPRKDKVFLAQNCSAFNDNLLDSELFGHVKGAFTGAIRDKKGLFELADGGTLFLDEIGDTSLTMQVKLLRVLQEGTFLPVGATSAKKVDVRIIAATNKDLAKAIQDGEFREDFFYRIHVINVQLPPLRERREDILLLTQHFLQKICGEMGGPTKALSKKVLEKLIDFPWPGNVRELQNEISRATILAGESRTIEVGHLSPKIIDFYPSPTLSFTSHSTLPIDFKGDLKGAVEQLERVMIDEGLRRCHYNKSQLAKELGISRANLIMKVEKFGLDRRRKAS